MGGRLPDRRLRLALLVALAAGVANAPGALAVLNDSVSIGGNAFTTGIWICSGTGSQTVTASADAWVGEASPDQNHGSATELSVGSAASANARALVTFVLPTLPPACSVTSATLRMFDATPAPLRTIEAFQASSAWTENVVTWNSQPAAMGAGAASSSPLLAGWQSWDVTGQVQAMYAGSNHGFLLADRSEGSLVPAEQLYVSLEAGSNPPELVVAWA